MWKPGRFFKVLRSCYPPKKMDESSPSGPYDLVLSFTNEDKEFGLKLADVLKNDFRIWYPADSHSRKHAAEAIVDCKVFIVIMSAGSAVNQQVRDEVALAYITGSIIIPVGLQMYPDVSKHMDSAMLLTLAKINWCFFTKDDNYEEKLHRFLAEVSDACQNSDTFFTVNDIKESVKSEYLHKFEYSFNRQVSVKRQESTTPRPLTIGVDIIDSIIELPDFWERHWGATQSVDWVDFWDSFLSDYQITIEDNFNKDFIGDFKELMYKDIFESHEEVDFSTYTAFCGGEEATLNTPVAGDLFFNCMRDYTIGYFAIREVFKMESSVRMAAIQNLVKFQTPSVIASLCDLTEDKDANIRAVAAIGLAKAGKWNNQVERVLERILNDEDCYVRQSACIAAALLHRESMTEKLSEHWRNDPISRVREAAELALNYIGGEGAVQALNITQKLSSEMKKLHGK